MTGFRIKKVETNFGIRFQIQGFSRGKWRSFQGFYLTHSQAQNNLNDWNEMENCDDARALQVMGYC